MSQPLYPQGKSLWYPLDRRLDGPQSRSGRGGEEKNSQSPPEIEPKNPDRPTISLIVIPTELSRLLKHALFNCVTTYVEMYIQMWMFYYR
jgi:hypothetical protein